MLGKSSREPGSEGKSSVAGRGGGGDTSLISRGMRIVGDCETEGRLRIDGSVSGNVTAGELELGSSGSIEGDVVLREEGSGQESVVIQGTVHGGVRGARVEVGPEGRIDGGVVATEALVHGRVHGGILAERRLVLEETAVVEGDVRARRLALKEGGQVNGAIRMGEAATTDEGEKRPIPGGGHAAGSTGGDESARKEGSTNPAGRKEQAGSPEGTEREERDS